MSHLLPQDVATGEDEQITTNMPIQMNVQGFVLPYHQQKPHLCDICGKRFTRKLKIHMLAHIKQGHGFECPIFNCNEKVYHFESVEDHVVDHHQISTVAPAQCKLCQRQYTDSVGLIMHFFTEHDIDYEIPVIDRRVYRKKEEENQRVDFKLQNAIFLSQVLTLWITLGGGQMDVMQAMVMQNLLGITVGASQRAAPEHPRTSVIQRLPETPADSILACEQCDEKFVDPVLHLAHHHEHREETLKCVLCGHLCKDDNDRILHLKFHLSY